MENAFNYSSNRNSELRPQLAKQKACNKKL